MLEPPEKRKCVDCGQKAAQYDHVGGYDKPEDVEPVCASCHNKRTARRLYDRGAPVLRLKPTELREAPGDWRHGFSWGLVKHPKGDFEVNADFADEMIGSFQFMRDTYGYYPPISAEHAIEIEFPNSPGEMIEIDGISYGLVTNIEARNDGVWMCLAFNKLGRWLNDQGAFAYVSPSFYPEYEDPHTGRVLRNLLREFAQVSVPHMKKLETPVEGLYGLHEDGFYPHTKLTETLMSTDNNKKPTPEPKKNTDDEGAEEPSMQQLMDTMKEVASSVTSLAERVTALENMDEEPEENGDGEDDEMAEMRDELEKMKKQLADEQKAREFSEALVAVQDQLPTIDAETARDLAQVRVENRERYDRLAKKFTALADDVSTLENGKVGSGTPPRQNRKPVTELIGEAKENGVKRGAGLISFMTSNGYEPHELDDAFFAEAQKAYGAR